MVDHEPGIGEAHRRIDEANRRIDARVTQVAHELARTHDRAEVADVREDVKQLRDSLVWAWRTAITGVVLPVLVSVVAAIALVVILGSKP
jgi:hypothetical protein